jgi:coniferyl-aldehyde dehydrogenase
MNASEKFFYEMQDCLIKQKNAFIKEGPPSLAQRKKSLKSLRQAILDNREEIEQALISDFGNRS